ncbi:Oral-Facial-Digital Syndrome 1 Protein [Manis pentadactyla]|nr:Oral-Facial-Digital Syndrome 1 Protein [Manis pentadactyla]
MLSLTDIVINFKGVSLRAEACNDCRATFQPRPHFTIFQEPQSERHGCGPPPLPSLPPSHPPSPRPTGPRTQVRCPPHSCSLWPPERRLGAALPLLPEDLCYNFPWVDQGCTKG